VLWTNEEWALLLCYGPMRSELFASDQSEVCSRWESPRSLLRVWLPKPGYVFRLFLSVIGYWFFGDADWICFYPNDVLWCNLGKLTKELTRDWLLTFGYADWDFRMLTGIFGCWLGWFGEWVWGSQKRQFRRWNMCLLINQNSTVKKWCMNYIYINNS